jgi:quinol monooxygenase YgiN
MAFVQILEFRTSNFEKVQALDDEWRRATEGKRTLRRSIVARDRNDPHRYLVLAFFDSPESAATNSELPATTTFANQVSAIVDAPLAFQDLDIVEDQT